jgi:hypothetical protein
MSKQSKPWTKIVEKPPVVEEIAVAEPVEPVAPGALQAAKDDVAKIHQEYAYELEMRALEYKTKLAQALKVLGDLEVREAQSIDAATSGKLRETLASMKESQLSEDVRDARLDAGAMRQEALRKRSAPILAQAAQARKLLAAFDREYGSMLEELRAISRSTWLEGTPATAPDAHHAHNFYSNIENGLAAIQRQRDSLIEMLRTDRPFMLNGEISGGFEPEVQRLIQLAAKGWDQNDERAYVWATTRLALATPDAVGMLQQLARGVTGWVMKLNAMKSSANVESVRYVKPLPEKPLELQIADGDIPGAVKNWNVFGEAK